MRMCGAADVRMFKRVNCGEILRGLSADVMGKMRRCGYVITLSSRISCFLLLLLQYLKKAFTSLANFQQSIVIHGGYLSTLHVDAALHESGFEAVGADCGGALYGSAA